MKKILVPAVLIGALPLAASAEQMSKSELDMFRSATVSLQKAGETALQAHQGTLASVQFGDEDGRAAYEAVVIGSDNEPWTVVVDAASGDVLASAKASASKDPEDEQGEAAEADEGAEAEND